MALRFAFLLLFISLGAFVSLSQAAAIGEFDEQWEDSKERDSMIPDEKSSSLENSHESDILEEVKEGEKTDPRLHRKKRQALFNPFFPVFSTKKSRRRLAYPYAYPYYTNPYYSYSYSYPYAPFYGPGIYPGINPALPNVLESALATSACGCSVTDTNCLSTCYYNQYLQGNAI